MFDNEDLVVAAIRLYKSGRLEEAQGKIIQAWMGGSPEDRLSVSMKTT
jgi:hypothetical protein